MTKAMRVVTVLLLAVMMVMSMASLVNAGESAEFSFDNIDTDFVTNGASDTSGAAKSINKIIGAVLTIVQVVGCGVAVIMLIVLAIKYISAAPGDKADIKKHAVVYVVGAIVLFAASGILQIVKNFADNVQGS